MNTYSAKLRDPRWQRKRLEIMNRDNFVCRLCGDKDSTLNVHHLRYERGADPWDYADFSLVTLCEGCHEEMHVSKFGEGIIEALVAGGANLGDLYGILYLFQHQFMEESQLPRERWESLVDALTYSMMAVVRGADARAVRNALSEWLEE